MRTITLLSSLSLAALFGCATVAPPQLVEARQAYEQSSQGLAAKLTPTELYDAKKVLDKANAEFDADGDTLEVRDRAYIALRKIQLADVKARTEIDRQRITQAANRGIIVRDEQVRTSRAALDESQQQLEGERAARGLADAEAQATRSAQGRELERSQARFDVEREARATSEGKLATSEGKLADAMKDLATIAAVKEESRGLVITLSGSVLFASGQTELLQTARSRLDQVAAALIAQGEAKQIVVEGHTDSYGTDASNQPLSLGRASVVRDYLVSRGVKAARIGAVGLGSSRPLVDNSSGENRANNRRVEIVVEPGSMTTR